MEPSYRLIPLTLGQFAKVDLADYDFLMRWKWHAKWSDHTCTYYAATNRKVSDDPALPKYIRMHQLITGNVQTDHESGDTLDNQRGNLRPATNAQNMHNRKVGRNSKTGFKGVAPKRHCQTGEYNGRYSATIRVNGRIEHIGYFGSPVEAARAYDKRARETRGEFARLNFP